MPPNPSGPIPRSLYPPNMPLGPPSPMNPLNGTVQVLLLFVAFTEESVGCETSCEMLLFDVEFALTVGCKAKMKEAQTAAAITITSSVITLIFLFNLCFHLRCLKEPVRSKLLRDFSILYPNLFQLNGHKNAEDRENLGEHLYYLNPIKCDKESLQSEQNKCRQTPAR